MKAVISTTYSDTYLYFLPIVTWCWNKIGVEVICFMPFSRNPMECPTGDLVLKTIQDNNLKCSRHYFWAAEHKEATYCQTARLYVGCLGLPMNDEPIITSDCDMLVFGDYLKQYRGDVCLFGADLLEGEKMYPMCYCSMTLKTWREVMDIGDKTLQQCLDEKLGLIEAEHFRGNYWCFDQELLYNQIQKSNRPVHKYNRAKLPERFATRRLDRDDSFLMEREVTGIIDFHLPRPGYEEQNFDKIITILKKIYPYENFDWLISYTEQYRKIL